MMAEAAVDPRLKDFTIFSHSNQGIAHDVYVIGVPSHPPVLVMHELPGLAEPALSFARRLSAQGFHVYLPHLFGQMLERDTRGNYRRLCVSQEFAKLKAGVSAPITTWLRSLSRHMSTEHEGRPVGAIGMCVTGAFAIPLVLDPWVTAPVASQPAVPFSMAYFLTGVGKGSWARELNVADIELAAAADRLKAENLTLLAFRFKSDRISVSEKIQRLRDACGAQIESHEYDGPWWRSIANPPHAVLTEEYDKAQDADPEHPTRLAFARLVGFLREHLE